MSYYASNRPYNSSYEQKDGNANGAIIGGLAGAAAVGGVHGFGKKAIGLADSAAKYRNANLLKAQENALKQNASKEAKSVIQDRLNKNNKLTQRVNKAEGLYNKAFGGGWRKAAAYGGSALLGMGAGAGIDAMMD